MLQPSRTASMPIASIGGLASPVRNRDATGHAASGWFSAAAWRGDPAGRDCRYRRRLAGYRGRDADGDLRFFGGSLAGDPAGDHAHASVRELVLTGRSRAIPSTINLQRVHDQQPRHVQGTAADATNIAAALECGAIIGGCGLRAPRPYACARQLPIVFGGSLAGAAPTITAPMVAFTPGSVTVVPVTAAERKQPRNRDGGHDERAADHRDRGDSGGGGYCLIFSSTPRSQATFRFEVTFFGRFHPAPSATRERRPTPRPCRPPWGGSPASLAWAP